MASVDRRTSTSFTDPDALQPLLNCSLIALDENPGVQPIGIGETSRKIIAKAVLQVVKQNVLDLDGCLQLCAGQCAGCEVAVHAMKMIFGNEDTEGGQNIRPIFLKFLNNFYIISSFQDKMYKCLTKIKFGLTLCLSMYFFLFQAPLSSQVLTVLLPPCLLMAHLYCHRKVPHRVIPWQCSCMLLVLCLSFDN